MTHRRIAVLVGVVLAGVFLGTAPTSSATGASAPAARTRSADISTLTPAQFENRLLNRLNARRTAIGCPTVAPNSALRLAARRHTARMVADNTLSHQLPGEASLGVRITRAGYAGWRLLGETLATGSTTPSGIFAEWVASPVHRAIIQNCRFRDAGFGVAYHDGVAWATGDYGRR